MKKPLVPEMQLLFMNREDTLRTETILTSSEGLNGTRGNSRSRSRAKRDSIITNSVISKEFNEESFANGIVLGNGSVNNKKSNNNHGA